jgi:hypothetical protein
VTYKTAWFMAHRIREAMTDPNPAPLGGEGKVVKADEMCQGTKEQRPKLTRRGKPTIGGKRAVLGLVERGDAARAVHAKPVAAKNVGAVLAKHADPASRLHTDKNNLYPKVGTKIAAHETVWHSAGECARGDVTTNSAEGYFGIFKRGMRGMYQHCGEQHLQRYLNEFSFRYNNRSKLGIEDRGRATPAVKGIEGKRLTYRGPRSAQNA